MMDLLTRIEASPEARVKVTVPRETEGIMNRLEYRRSLGLPKSGLEESTEDHPWQPIDTAPKDGTPILGFIPSYYQGKGGMVVAVWMDFSDRPGWYSEISSVHEPTHWMPLPAPPREENGK